VLNKNFSNWKDLRENTNVQNKSLDIFTKIPQEKGDIVYFGIHDLSKYYRENKKLPDLNLYDIFEKKGEIIDVDPANQQVKISMNKTPFQYGYRKLENEKDKMRRYMRADDKIEIKIPTSSLQDISHLIDAEGLPVYLVIDGNTKYQKSLIQAIRKGEIKKANQPKSPSTRHYDKYDGGDFTLEDEDDDKYDSSDFTLEDDDKEETHVAHFDPSISSKSRNWRMFTETRRYEYYPE
jgi:hypothetical protein